MMLRSLIVAAGLAFGSLPIFAQPAIAAFMSPAPEVLAGEGLVEQAQFRYCRRWHRECRYRWGYGWRYRRCMRRHGC
jgi:hypothetical protein